MKNSQKPTIALLVGESAVGRSRLGETLAAALFGHESRCLDLGMKDEISRLIGAPAGYVGYNEGGLLSAPLPLPAHSVILLLDDKVYPHDTNEDK